MAGFSESLEDYLELSSCVSATSILKRIGVNQIGFSDIGRMGNVFGKIVTGERECAVVITNSGIALLSHTDAEHQDLYALLECISFKCIKEVRWCGDKLYVTYESSAGTLKTVALQSTLMDDAAAALQQLYSDDTAGNLDIEGSYEKKRKSEQRIKTTSWDQEDLEQRGADAEVWFYVDDQGCLEGPLSLPSIQEVVQRRGEKVPNRSFCVLPARPQSFDDALTCPARNAFKYISSTTRPKRGSMISSDRKPKSPPSKGAPHAGGWLLRKQYLRTEQLRSGSQSPPITQPEVHETHSGDSRGVNPLWGLDGSGTRSPVDHHRGRAKTMATRVQSKTFERRHSDVQSYRT